MTRNPELYQYLPLYAKLAIECLDRSADRTPEKLDEMLEAYAATYGDQVNAYIRESAHFRASKRFADFKLNGLVQK